MANPFDQFDGPPLAAGVGAAASANPFDQFDAPSASAPVAAASGNIFDRFDAALPNGRGDYYAPPALKDGQPPAAAPAPASGAESAGYAGAQRIFEAARQGWNDSPPILTPQATAALNKTMLGRWLYDPALKIAGGVLATGNAALKGAQQGVIEGGREVGLPDTLTRDIAALPEAFPVGGVETGLHMPEVPEAPGAPRPTEPAPPGAAAAVPGRLVAAEAAKVPPASPEAANVAAAPDSIVADIAAGKPAAPPEPEVPQATDAQLDAMERQVIGGHPAPTLAPSAPEALPEAAAPTEAATLAEAAPEPRPAASATPAAAPPRARGASAQTPYLSVPKGLGKPVDAVQLLAAKGGIRPDADLLGMDADKVNVPFVGKLVKPDGMSLNSARELLDSQGYALADPTDDRSVYRIIEEHQSGRPTYAGSDLADAFELQQISDHNSEIDRLAAQYGIETRGRTAAQFADDLAEHVSLDEAARMAQSEADAFDAADAEFGRRAAALGTEPAEYAADDAPRSIEDLEDEYRQEEAAAGPAEDAGRPGGPEAATGGAGAGQEGDGSRPGGAGAGSGDTGEVAAPAGGVEPAEGTPAARVGSEVGAPAEASSSGLTTHTTQKGKVLTGTIRRDITYAEAKALDPYTFKKDGGFFIRGEPAEAAVDAPRSKMAAEPAVEATAPDTVAADAAAETERRNMQATRLRDQAKKMQAIAAEDEARDRLSNTPKRARQAATAAEDARARQQIATTMQNLADGIERGEAPRLAAVSSRAAVEQLDGILRQAVYARQRAEKLPYAEQQRQIGAPITEADIAYAEMPSISLHQNWTRDVAAAIEKAAPRGNAPLIRWLRNQRDDGLVYPTAEIARQFRDAFAAVRKKAGKLPYDLQRVADSIAQRDRITRLGIANDGDLRSALREYLQYRGARKQESPIARLERELVGQKPGIDFFPTPKALADRLVQEADIRPGMRVLEPSAGKGDLADAARDAGAQVDTVEMSPTLQALLSAKGHNVVGSDFNDFQPAEGYDRIIMNPPFSKGQDAAHIERAYGMLKPGGRLVAISGEGVHFRGDSQAAAFRDWLDAHGAVVEKLPEGSFKSAFRPTGVNTRLVVIDKPEASAPEVASAVAQEPKAPPPLTEQQRATASAPPTDLLGRPITEPAPARVAAPTIRNDARQDVMPGMGPSAVQAQAARDAQGRGALQGDGVQKAADEGLFAPDTSGQGKLYSFPGALADPDLWRNAFKGVDRQALRRQLGLGLTNKDEMGVAGKVADEIKTLFAPTSRGNAAKEAEYIIRRRASMLARSSNQSVHALDRFASAIDRLPVEQQLAITERAERGEAQPTPAIQAAMSALRQQQDTWVRMIRSLGKGYLEQARENYMGHIWGNYREWKAGQEAPPQTEAERIAMARGISKRPIQGSGAFLKQRTFDTQAEGIAAGLAPVTTNPIKMQILKLREMQKFYHGARMADEIKASGLAKWVPATSEAESVARENGWERLDDKQFQPRIPGGSVDAFGRVEPGNWYAPEPAARVFNNYVSQGLAGNSTIYDGIRSAGNALNSAQLGLSGYHATFVTLDSMMSRMALGMQQVSRAVTGRDLGQMSRATSLGRGVRSIASSVTPAAPIETVMHGSRLRQAWLDPANATPEMRRLADMLNTGGGRINMDQFYRSNASGAFFKNLHDLKNPSGAFRDAWQMVHDTPLSAPFKLVGRLMDTINEPLMGQFVPRMKVGVFSELARDFTDRFPDASPEEVSAAMTKAWDSVENRMGQMTYDNVFWNKMQKDMAFLMTRSVGWNLGTIREIGGAGVDGVGQLWNMAHGRAPELTNRMAYTLAMPAMTALVGGTLTYLLTGHGPQQMLDYFYPPTGTVTNGEPDRLSIPGYIKDVVAYAKAPVQTLLNKLQPLFETAVELRNNRDYYGGIINDPARDNPMVSYPEYLLNQSIPFSIRAMRKDRASGASAGAQALAFWGIQPAPQSIMHPERGEAYQMRDDVRAYRKRARESGRLQFGP